MKDIDSPLPRYTMAVLVVRKILLNLRVMLESGKDVLDGQTLVLGAEQVCDSAALYIYNIRVEGSLDRLRFFCPEMS